MPLDLSGFAQQPNQWAGLYHAADQLEKRKLRADQLSAQRDARRNAAGTFLQNYLDPKDYLSGTQYDPMILKSLQGAMQEGAKLAAAGADSPTLMMALGPMVNKISSYSTNAKTINKQVDDQIKLMRESGLTGYDYGALKDAAMNKAFFNEKGMIDPNEIDPTANYIQKAIEESPEKLTTAAGLDLFAKNSPMSKTLFDRQQWTGLGKEDRTKVHTIGQTWLTPDRDATGSITDLVPKHDIATEKGNPLIHQFVDESGNVTKAPVRLLNEDVFDDMMQRRPDIADYLRGVVKQHLKEYTDQGGKPISENDPKAKLIARAIAYDELNRRKAATIERADINDKPSQALVSYNIKNLPGYADMLEKNSAAITRGRKSITGKGTANAVEILARASKGDESVLIGEPEDKNGSLMYNITPMFKGGGLSSGRGADFKYKGIYFDPGSKDLLIEKETTDKLGMKHKTTETIPRKDLKTFMYKIAQANGVGIDEIKGILDKLEFDKVSEAELAKDIEARKTRFQRVMDKLKNPFGKQE